MSGDVYRADTIVPHQVRAGGCERPTCRAETTDSYLVMLGGLDWDVRVCKKCRKRFYIVILVEGDTYILGFTPWVLGLPPTRR